MKVLVVNDERCYGSLLASALKKLGHRAVISTSRGEAHRALSNEPIDAAIIDIEMPEAPGIELAAELAAQNQGLALAFSAGSAGASAVAQAERLGKVLPKVWTIADVKVVIEDLIARVRAARSSTIASALPPVALTTPRPAHNGGDVDKPARPAVGSGRIPVIGARQATKPSAPVRPRGVQGTNPPPSARSGKSDERRAGTRLSVSCKSWGQVRRLCDEHLRGSTSITVRARHQLSRGQTVTIALSLPSEMALSLEARIAGAEATSGGRTEYTVELTSLTRDYARRLLALCEANEQPTSELRDVSWRESEPGSDSSESAPRH